jgi:hypothetical protein
LIQGIGSWSEGEEIEDFVIQILHCIRDGWNTMEIHQSFFNIYYSIFAFIPMQKIESLHSLHRHPESSPKSYTKVFPRWPSTLVLPPSTAVVPPAVAAATRSKGTRFSSRVI